MEGNGGPLRRGEVGAKKSGAIGESPFEASPLTERDGDVPCEKQQVVCGSLQRGLDLLQQQLHVGGGVG